MSSVSSNGWVEVQVSTTADAGELLACLQDLGAIGAWECDGSVRLYWAADRWGPATVEALHVTLRQLVGGQNLSEGGIAVQSIPDTDWNARWAASVKPIRVGRRIVIRPSWEVVAVAPGDLELVLDPRQAFGTGHHATTRLLLEWLETQVHGGERVLDVGTGSGILAMAALRLGARAAFGIDSDPVAIGCARDYATVNGFGAEFQLAVGTVDSVSPTGGAPWDLVLANLDRRTLVRTAPSLASRLCRGGRLLVSGLLVDDRVEVCRAFGEQGGVCRGTRERDGWLALELVWAEGCEGDES